MYKVCPFNLCRCDGEYCLTVYAPNCKPQIGYRGQRTSEKHHLERYGDISADHLDGDKVAYAKQASEGHLFIRLPGQSVSMKDYLVEGTPNKKRKMNVMLIGFISSELQKVFSKKKVKTDFVEENVMVAFELKYSYFERLHKVINYLPKAVIAKIMPEPQNETNSFCCCDEVDPLAITIPHRKEDFLYLDKHQFDTLKSAVVCESKAPYLIIGSFGTGKTRLLARLAFEIMKEKGKSASILICAHHQASADAFVTNYFAQMKGIEKNVCRLMSDDYTFNENYMAFYATAKEITRFRKYLPRIIVTTHLTSLHLREYMNKKGYYFTHILMDEGAQTREPESVAPLCMARSDTTLIIAGDHKQVHMCVCSVCACINRTITSI